jgi:hypothetical protein
MHHLPHFAFRWSAANEIRATIAGLAALTGSLEVRIHIHIQHFAECAINVGEVCGSEELRNVGIRELGCVE